MNRTKIIIIGAGVFLILIVVILMLSTGGKKKPDNGGQQTASNKIVIWDSFDSEKDLTFAINQYKNKNPEIEITYVKKNPANYETESLNAIASGGGPDIWVIPSSWMPKQHNKLSAMPDFKLDSGKKKSNASVYRDTYLKVVSEDNIFADQVYGVPLFVDSLSLFYNSGLMNKKYQEYVKDHPGVDMEKLQAILARPPLTWDDLATFIQYYGNNAIALGTSSNIKDSGDILTALMMQYGAQMNSEDHTAALFHTANNLINPDEAYPGSKALTFYTTFAKAGDPHKTWDKANGNSYQAFVKNEIAMMIDYTQDAKQVEVDAKNPPGVAKLPQIKDTQTPVDLAYYQTFTVPKTSTNVSRAWDFINYISNEPQILSQYLTTKGLASALKSQTANSQSFIDVQNNYSQTWYNPDQAEVDKIFAEAIDQTLNGQRAQTVLEGSAARITTLLQNLKETTK